MCDTHIVETRACNHTHRNHQSSANQPSTISHQPSAISHQPSVISHQPSVGHAVKTRACNGATGLQPSRTGCPAASSRRTITGIRAGSAPRPRARQAAVTTSGCLDLDLGLDLELDPDLDMDLELDPDLDLDLDPGFRTSSPNHPGISGSGSTSSKLIPWLRLRPLRPWHGCGPIGQLQGQLVLHNTAQHYIRQASSHHGCGLIGQLQGQLVLHNTAQHYIRQASSHHG